MPASIPLDDFDDDALAHVAYDIQARLWDLESKADNAHKQVLAIQDRIDAMRPDLAHAEREVRHLETAAEADKLFRATKKDDPDGRNFVIVREIDNDRLTAARRRVDQVKARIKTETDQRTAQAAVWATHAHRHREAYEYLTTLKHKDVPLKIVDLNLDEFLEDDTLDDFLKENEPLPAALERVRAEIASIKDEVRTVRDAPATIADAKVKMHEAVAKLADSGEPDIVSLFSSRSDIDWPMWTVPQMNVAGHTVRTIDAGALLAWLHKDALIAALDQKIDDYGAGVEGRMMTAEERRKRLAELDYDAFTLQFYEEAIINRSTSLGAPLAPRDGVDVRAVLMLSPSSPAPRAHP